MSKESDGQTDAVDCFRAQWAKELPDLETAPMMTLGRINRIAKLVHPEITAIFAAHGLDRGEFDVIGTLRRSGPPYLLTPTQLYTSLMLSSGGLTNRLDRLEESGLIIREQSSDDKRSHAARLTKKGVRLAEAAFRADMASELVLLGTLDEDEQEMLAQLLRKLLAALEQRLGPD